MLNKNLRREFGINGKKSIEKISPDKVWDRWESLIKELIKSGGSNV